jgi:hypothetical protein
MPPTSESVVPITSGKPQSSTPSGNVALGFLACLFSLSGWFRVEVIERVVRVFKTLRRQLLEKVDHLTFFLGL